MVNRRPPDVTRLATVGMPMCERHQTGLPTHWTRRGGPATESLATALLSALLRYWGQSSMFFGQGLTVFLPPTTMAPRGVRTRIASSAHTSPNVSATIRLTMLSPWGRFTAMGPPETSMYRFPSVSYR